MNNDKNKFPKDEEIFYDLKLKLESKNNWNLKDFINNFYDEKLEKIEIHKEEALKKVEDYRNKILEGQYN